MKASPVHPDIEMLQVVAGALGPLRDQVTFVGGATTTLYVDDPAAPASVATLDVDCVVELSGLLSSEALNNKLRKLGFKQPVNETNPPICRWGLGDIIVDIMPSDPTILGFSNRWYPDGIANREMRKLPDGTSIYVFSIPFFVGSKLEAVKSRGGSDLRLSHDLEDIVLVLSGASGAKAALQEAPKGVKAYLKTELKGLLKNSLFREAIEGTLAVRNEDAGRAQKIIELIQEIAQSG